MATSLDDDWDAAAADAGVASDSVVLYPAAPAGDCGAMYFRPGDPVDPRENSFAYTAQDRARLRELVDVGVLVVREDLAPPHRVLVLRHEAEHVAQAQASSSVAAFSQRLTSACPSEEGWKWLYHTMPHERDADAAATAFRKANGIEISDEVLNGEERFLYNAPWPGPEDESLPLRLLAHSLFFPDRFDLACRLLTPAMAADALAEAMVAGGAAARAQNRWRLTGFFDGLADRAVSPEEFEQMSPEERYANTDSFRAAVVEKEGEVVEHIRAALAE